MREKDIFIEVYEALADKQLTKVDVNPVIADLSDVTIRWQSFAASGHVDQILSAIENANSGDYESLRHACDERGLLEK